MLLVGTEHLAKVPEYLRLRSVVVVAPTPAMLARWQQEGFLPRTARHEAAEGLCVDVPSRRLMWRGSAVPLTDLEFRVAACLGGEPGRAWSYVELREAGWGPGPELPIDVFAVRSVIQRIRRKLGGVGASVLVEAVRGYGFRLEPPDAGPGTDEA